MSAFARAFPEDWQERLDALAQQADRCPHGEDRWRDCETCVADERDTRIWERSQDR